MYKAFGSAEAARRAYTRDRGNAIALQKADRLRRAHPIGPALCVDASCSGSPGPVEFRAVELESGRQLFRQGPYAHGTNNIGEFLALVEALRWMQEHRHAWTVFSDSLTAQSWVRSRKCNTQLGRSRQNGHLFSLIRAAEADLQEHALAWASIPIRTWQTKDWGENPADFGRK